MTEDGSGEDFSYQVEIFSLAPKRSGGDVFSLVGSNRVLCEVRLFASRRHSTAKPWDTLMMRHCIGLCVKASLEDIYAHALQGLSYFSATYCFADRGGEDQVVEHPRHWPLSNDRVEQAFSVFHTHDPPGDARVQKSIKMVRSDIKPERKKLNE